VEEKMAKTILAHRAEKIEIINKTEEKVQEKLKEKTREFKQSYDREIQIVKQQFYEVWMTMMHKEQIITKLFYMLKQQEKLILHVKHVLKVNGLGQIKLEDLQKPKVKDEENKEITMLKARVTTLKESYYDLLNNMEDLKHIHLQTQNDWSKSEFKVKQLEKDILDLKENHKEDIKKLNDEFKLRELKLITEKENLTANYSKYQDDLKKELKIREELVSRFSNYSDHLKKQVVVCKNVIKNPKIMSDAMRKFNYDELQLYKYDKKFEDTIVFHEKPFRSSKHKDISVDKLMDNQIIQERYNKWVALKHFNIF
jgi:hypothetical protein